MLRPDQEAPYTADDQNGFGTSLLLRRGGSFDFQQTNTEKISKGTAVITLAPV
jgi:hypothetical protein